MTSLEGSNANKGTELERGITPSLSAVRTLVHSDGGQGQGQLTCLCATLCGSDSLEAEGFTVTVPNHGAQQSLGIRSDGLSV